MYHHQRYGIYIRIYRKEKDKKEPKKIVFRNKDNGWKYFNLKIYYTNSKFYRKNQVKDLYMKVFLQNLSLRDSCYDCKFKKYNRMSDITLADFWGIDNIMPEMNDNKGTSLVIINSEKGKELFESIKDEMVCRETNLDEAIKYNPSMIKSVELNPNREKFFNELDKMEFDRLANKYLIRASLIKRGIEKMKRIIRM